MSKKRGATTDLNHDNWDQDDVPEERGTFQVANSSRIENRTFRKARRRGVTMLDTSGINEKEASPADKKSIFCGFAGFGTNESKSTLLKFSKPLQHSNYNFPSFKPQTSTTSQNPTSFQVSLKPKEDIAKISRGEPFNYEPTNSLTKTEGVKECQLLLNSSSKQCEESSAITKAGAGVQKSFFASTPASIEKKVGQKLTFNTSTTLSPIEYLSKNSREIETPYSKEHSNLPKQEALKPRNSTFQSNGIDWVKNIVLQTHKRPRKMLNEEESVEFYRLLHKLNRAFIANCYEQEFVDQCHNDFSVKIEDYFTHFKRIKQSFGIEDDTPNTVVPSKILSNSELQRIKTSPFNSTTDSYPVNFDISMVDGPDGRKLELNLQSKASKNGIFSFSGNASLIEIETGKDQLKGPQHVQIQSNIEPPKVLEIEKATSPISSTANVPSSTFTFNSLPPSKANNGEQDTSKDKPAIIFSEKPLLFEPKKADAPAAFPKFAVNMEIKKQASTAPLYPQFKPNIMSSNIILPEKQLPAKLAGFNSVSQEEVPITVPITNQSSADDGAEENLPPPVPETVQHEEPDSLFSIKSKMLYKRITKNKSEFVERGIGMLHVKKADQVGKVILVLRSTDALGTLYLNVELSRKLPPKRNKNQLVFVTILNPPIPVIKGDEANVDKGDATQILLRVKKEEDAQMLLEEIEKVLNS